MDSSILTVFLETLILEKIPKNNKKLNLIGKNPPRT
jgi:hypothetical protein